MNLKQIRNVMCVAVAVSATLLVGCNNDDGDSGEDGVPTPTKTTFVDSRDNKSYQKVKIGRQVWMAENLNYATSGSKCYDNDPANCDLYGKLYAWNDAKNACPAGWHLPTDAEWAKLGNYVGDQETAGGKLKSTIGWNNNGNGTDEYGFSALPGGFVFPIDGGFYDVGKDGGWWSSSEYEATTAYCFVVHYNNEFVDWAIDVKTSMRSVRCVQN